jgi:hypothetical protein
MPALKTREHEEPVHLLERYPKGAQCPARTFLECAANCNAKAEQDSPIHFFSFHGAEIEFESGSAESGGVLLSFIWDGKDTVQTLVPVGYAKVALALLSDGLNPDSEDLKDA